MYKSGKEEISSKEELFDYFDREKYKNKKYLRELENFLDKADNIPDNRLKIEIIGKLHILEKMITTLAVDIIDDFAKKQK